MCGPAWRPSTVGALRRPLLPSFVSPASLPGGQSLGPLASAPTPRAGGTACLRPHLCGCLWSYQGQTRGDLWSYPGQTWGHPWLTRGVTLDRPGVTCGVTRDRPGVTRGVTRDRLGVTCGVTRDRPGPASAWTADAGSSSPASVLWFLESHLSLFLAVPGLRCCVSFFLVAACVLLSRWLPLQALQ